MTTEVDQHMMCPNGHNRKFFCTYTSVAWIAENIDGILVPRPLIDEHGAILVYHCADCGATLVVEADENGKSIEVT